jgi:glutamate synthase (NADPH/NADH) small chain
MIYRVSSAHEEGGLRDYSISTKSLSGENGVLKKLNGVRVEFVPENGRMAMHEVPGSEFEEDVDLLLLAMGFLGPERYMLDQLGVEVNDRKRPSGDQVGAWMWNWDVRTDLGGCSATPTTCRA